MAEMERDLVRERTTAALIVARRAGRVGGRKKVMTPKRIEAARKLLASGMSAREIAPTIGVSVATLYRHLPAPEHEAINAEEMEREGEEGATTIKPTESAMKLAALVEALSENTKNHPEPNTVTNNSN